MENILFEYPVNNENSSFDDEFQVLKARTNKIKYTVIIAVFCALVMYFLSAPPIVELVPVAAGAGSVFM